MGSSSSTVNSQASPTEKSEPIIAELGEAMLLEQPESSSSSGTGSIFLDNIDLFRQYSLDPELINLYFNRGVSTEFVDLEATEHFGSSSSSSEDFMIFIDLEGDESMFGEPYEFPEDMEFYFYEEKVDGVDAPGTFRAEKIAGQNRAVIMFASSFSSGFEHQFQVNIEHPTLMPITTTFRFVEQRAYYHSDSTTTRIKNSTARLHPDYVQSLLSWIGSFWAAYDLDDTALVPELPRTPANENTEFDPFAHARWKIRSGVISLTEITPLVEGSGYRTVNGWNFLGVSQDIWNCITKPGQPGGLYAIYYDEKSREFQDWVDGKGRRPNQLDKSFDCRSFTAAAAYALKDQLSGVCEVDVKYKKVGQDDEVHAILQVDMKGCAGGSTDCGNCCSGSFLYEPQTGRAFSSENSYCKKNPKMCLDESQWNDGQEIQDAKGPDFGLLEWEKDPAERQRIKDVICGCLTGEYNPASAESMIKSKCQSNLTFQNWFVSNFSHEPGKATSPMADMPDILSCERVVCEKGRETPDGPLCTQKAQEGEGGVTPYQCKTQCQEKWDCYEEAIVDEEQENFVCLAVYSLRGFGEFEDEQTCLNYCSDDKVCVHEWNIVYDCEAGQWTRENDGFSTPDCMARDRLPTPSSNWEDDGTDCRRKKFVFVGESSCDDSESCPRIANGPGAPLEVGSFPSETPTNCCGSWCEIDSERKLTGNCISGTLQDWTVKEKQKQALGFKLEPCDSEKCQECPPGYRTAGGSSPMLKSQSLLCVPDCNIPPNTCEEKFGPGYCCVENTILFDGTNLCAPCEGCCEPDPLSESQVCGDCPEKIKSLRFQTQWPEYGNRPFG